MNWLHEVLLWFQPDDWISTYTGKKFYFKRPDPSAICVEDIAHVLSRICRYGGHSEQFLSVAEHSVKIAEAVYYEFHDSELTVAALFHDSAETYTGDLVSPLKRILPSYKIVENRIMQAIASKFNFRWNKEFHDIIKIFDKQMFRREVLELRKIECFNKFMEVQPLNTVLEFWEPSIAKQKFLKLYEQLT